MVLVHVGGGGRILFGLGLLLFGKLLVLLTHQKADLFVELSDFVFGVVIALKCGLFMLFGYVLLELLERGHDVLLEIRVLIGIFQGSPAPLLFVLLFLRL